MKPTQTTEWISITEIDEESMRSYIDKFSSLIGTVALFNSDDDQKTGMYEIAIRKIYDPY